MLYCIPLSLLVNFTSIFQYIYFHFWNAAGREPVGTYTDAFCGRSLSKQPYTDLIAGDDLEDASEFVLEINRHFLPDNVIAFAGSRVGAEVGSGLVPLTEGMAAIQDKPAVYIYENCTCRAQITELEELRLVLSSRR